MIHIAVLGAGGIAVKMSNTLKGMVAKKPDRLCMYAVASRDIQKAQKMADEFGYQKAYGSYEEMLNDKRVDLVYVATPHSLHERHIKLCLEHGKHVLCEKAFTLNARQAEEVCRMAEGKGLLLTEAIWTRYMPSRKLISDVLAEGSLGRPKLLTANLCYAIDTVERIRKPELAGGALLDLGVYTLNFASMVFGDELASMDSAADKMDTGVDLQERVTLRYKDGKTAILTASAGCYGDRRGIVMCENGYLEVDNINNPLHLYLQENPRLGTPPRVIHMPPQITGYEYEVEACIAAIEAGKVECEAMPHAETIRMMKWMDELRGQWGVKYPGE